MSPLSCFCKWSDTEIICADSIIMCGFHVGAEEIRSYKLGIGRPIILARETQNFFQFVTVNMLNTQMVPYSWSRKKKCCTTHSISSLNIFKFYERWNYVVVLYNIQMCWSKMWLLYEWWLLASTLSEPSLVSVKHWVRRMWICIWVLVLLICLSAKITL